MYVWHMQGFEFCRSFCIVRMKNILEFCSDMRGMELSRFEFELRGYGCILWMESRGCLRHVSVSFRNKALRVDSQQDYMHANAPFLCSMRSLPHVGSIVFLIFCRPTACILCHRKYSVSRSIRTCFFPNDCAGFESAGSVTLCKME